MVLFVSAYNMLYGKSVPTQKIIFEALDSNNMLDVNAKAKYFKFVETNYLMSVDGGYGLKMDGERKVELILKEMADSSKNGFTDWDKPGKQRGKRQQKEDGHEDIISKWLDVEPNIEDFDIRTLKSATNYAMFGIYILTKQISVTKSVSYQTLHEYLSKKYTISVNKDALRKALSRPVNASRFLKTSEGGFYLTPQAEADVKGWLEGKPVDNKKD